LPGGQCGQTKVPILTGDSFGLRALPGKADLGIGDGSAGGIAQYSVPDGLCGRLGPGARREQKQQRKRQRAETVYPARRL